VRRQRFLTLLGTAAALIACTPAAWAQAGRFPEAGKTLRLVVPFAPGGGVDNAARLLGEQLRKQAGLTVVIENRAGANGTLGGKVVQTAPADGYTLLFSASTHVMARQVMSTPPYDPQTDFAPVARVGEAALLLVVPTSGPQRLAELLASARQQPDKLMAAIPAAGAASHLATLLLAKQAGVRFTYVPYKGTQPALTDVAGGHAGMLLDSMISLLPMAKAGRVRALAITSKQRSAQAPDIPTVQEAGIPNYAFESWYGVWAPKDTPADRVAALNTAINAATAELAKSGAFTNLGIEPVTESPETFRRYIATEVQEGADLLRAAGFKPE
jgi:tripartite-type tricarboxylate transporter receptor subunit TctC